jgi:hypothetical protein
MAATSRPENWKLETGKGKIDSETGKWKLAAKSQILDTRFPISIF